MPEIKICGIRSLSDAEYLNESNIQYAGFVLYEKSKRHVTTAQAREIMSGLSPGIKTVAVTVSPDAALVREVGGSGFDILQIHGSFDEAVLREKRPDLKIWRAVNVTDGHELAEFDWDAANAYDGVLLDAKDFGSGKTFGWETKAQSVAQMPLTLQIRTFRQQLKARGIRFILAGGLNAGNVAEGIALFSPDVVDVSSGVEADGKTPGQTSGTLGKSREKIKEFTKQVRKMEESR